MTVKENLPMLARSRKAFTLIELIIVLVILAILAALAIPTYQKVVFNAKINTTTQSIKALDREAQALAAEANDPSNVAGYLSQAQGDNTVVTVTAGGTNGEFIVTDTNTAMSGCLTPSTVAGANNAAVTSVGTAVPTC